MAKEYIVLSRQDAVARNNSPYVNLKVMSLEDGNETICVFDVPKTAGPRVGQLVRFLTIRENKGSKTATNMDMIPGAIPTELHPLYKFVPHPVKKEEWLRCINALLTLCSDKKLMDIIAQQAEKLYEPYSKYPAATSVHHSFPGGLLNHTYQMLHLLEGIYPTMPYPEDTKIERCILAIMFHDWGKTLEYTADGECTEYMYLLGHIYLSAQMLNKVLGEAEVPQREKNFIVHCVLAHHGELEYGSPVKPCIPEAQLVNYLDNISAKADVFNTAGNLEKSFALGTHVVK